MKFRKSTDNLGDLIKKTIADAVNPRIPGSSARRLGNGFESITNEQRKTADNTDVIWTYREIAIDSGTYLSPTASSFENVVIANDLDVTVGQYVGNNGDITRSFTTATGGYWGVYSAAIYADQDTHITLNIDCNYSCAVTLDDNIVMQSTTLGPNQEKYTDFVLTSGSRGELEIGVYAPTGTTPLRYAFTGAIANQVASLEPLDKTAPSTPNNCTLTAQQADPQNGSMRMHVTFSQKQNKEDHDLAHYDVHRAQTTTNSPPAYTEYNLHYRAGIPASGADITFYDPNLKYGDYYWYLVQAVDRENNRSLFNAAVGAQAIDSTAPSGATNLTEETSPWPTLTHLTWEWPDTAITENEDLKGGYITSGSVGGKKMSTVMYDGSTSGAAFFPTTPGSSITYYLTCFDWAGNTSTAVSTPIGDTSGPSDVTSVYVNDVLTASDGTATLANKKTEVKVYFVAPSDSDYSHTRVRIYDQSTMNDATAYAGSYIFNDIYGEPSSENTFTFVVEQAYAANNFRMFFDTYDKSGNYRGQSATPYHFNLVSTDDTEQDTMALTVTPEANENGWHNTTTFTMEWEPAGAEQTVGSVGGQWAIDGGAWTADGDRNITWANVGVGQTSGTTVAFRTLDDDSVPLIPVSRNFKVDTTAPTVGSIAASNVVNGIKLTVTPGSDAMSGLNQTLVYRNTSNDSGTATLIKTLESGDTEYIDTETHPGTVYYYWIKHTDYASNTSSFSTVESITAQSMHWAAHLNVLDNSSFEREDPTGNDHLESWTSAGGTPTGAGGFHGDRRAGLTNSRTVQQVGIPLIGQYYYLSAYCSRLSAAGITTGRLQLDFKDLSGTTLQTLNLDTSANGITGADWTRHSGDGSDLWVIGPSGSSAPRQYNVNAATVDITIQTTDGTFGYWDAIQMQEVVSGGVATWNSFETNSLAPTEYYDSRVLNRDRINAYVGRFAEIYANNITAGKLNSVDGNTYFDLDESEIRLEHTDFTGTGECWSVLEGESMKRTLDSGSSWHYFAPVKNASATLNTTGASLEYFDFQIASGVGDSFKASKFFVGGPAYIWGSVIDLQLPLVPYRNATAPFQDGSGNDNFAVGWASIYSTNPSSGVWTTRVSGYCDWSKTTHSGSVVFMSVPVANYVVV